MPIGSKRKVWLGLVLCSAGVVCQLLPGSCTNYYANAALQSINFCSIFNCDGGTYVDLCSGYPIFADCPNLQQTTDQP